VSAGAAATPTEPIDMGPLLQEPTTAPLMEAGPRADPQQWHRRGLLTPAEVHAIVVARINDLPTIVTTTPARSDELISPTEPTYGDFLRKPRA